MDHKHNWKVKQLTTDLKAPVCEICGESPRYDEITEVKGAFLATYWVNGIEHFSRRKAIEAVPKKVCTVETCENGITISVGTTNATKSKIPDNPLRYGVAEERQEPCSLPDAWYIENTPHGRKNKNPEKT